MATVGGEELTAFELFIALLDRIIYAFLLYLEYDSFVTTTAKTVFYLFLLFINLSASIN